MPSIFTPHHLAVCAPAGRRLQQGGSSDGRGCIDRGPGLWLGGTEVGYTGGAFTTVWALGNIQIADLASEVAVGTEIASGSASLRFPNRYAMTVPVLRTNVSDLYGSLCSCCALCLAQNFNSNGAQANAVRTGR